MRGFITESNLGQADEAFPGIARYFDSLIDKPRTFLELVAMFEHWKPDTRLSGGSGNVRRMNEAAS